MRLVAAFDIADDDPFVALVNKLFSMSAALGATLTFACLSLFDCVDDVELPEFRLELSRFRELFEVLSLGLDFSMLVKDPPDMAPYIGPKSELRLDVLDIYWDSMLELAAA
jgi:hypothetical protein